MYRSEHTTFNIADATPYGRDLMKELSEACARGGIDFGVYFSLIDWHYPQAYPISSHNADPLTPEHYLFNLKQVEEIMTRYGDISEIWFDMGSLTPEQSRGLYELVNRLQPQCMISGRLGNDFVDFSVMADNEYPDYRLAVPWQTAASVFDETWGYRSWQERGELQPKVEEKIESLIRVISRGGNYLLNIGPRGDGSIVAYERDLLQAIGQWVETNSEAVYATEAGPFHRSFPWGEVTAREDALYLFVKKAYAGRQIDLTHLDGEIRSVHMLSSREACRFSPAAGNRGAYTIEVPETFASSYEVLKLSFRNGYQVIPDLIVSDGMLTTANAISDYGHSSLNYYAGYKSLIAYNWSLHSGKQQVAPVLCFTENERGRTILLDVDGKREEVTLSSSRFTTERLSEKTIRWGAIYQKRGRGVFGFVEEENRPPVTPLQLEESWQPMEDFRYGEKLSIPLGQRESVLFLQEIESSRQQWVAVTIGSGNAVYILLNGKYITAHFSPDRVNYETEIVLLPLQKGMNQLIVKYYNGFEKELFFSLTPLTEWRVYTQPLPPVLLSGGAVHVFSLRDALPQSTVSPLRMSNVKIKLSSHNKR